MRHAAEEKKREAEADAEEKRAQREADSEEKKRKAELEMERIRLEQKAMEAQLRSKKTSETVGWTNSPTLPSFVVRIAWIVICYDLRDMPLLLNG